MPGRAWLKTATLCLSVSSRCCAGGACNGNGADRSERGKAQKEIRLRETLRQIRSAIDEFKRDTIGACPQGAVNTTNPTDRRQGRAAAVPTDPRSRVVIDDCTIFDTENLDRYPPELETLVEGVRVKPRGINLTGGSGISGDSKQATEMNDASEEVIKHYLAGSLSNPMTGNQTGN